MTGALLRRDLALLLPFGPRGAGLLPVLFFVAVAMLMPFAIGPDAALLARTGGGILWVAALLASILPLDRIVAADVEQGTFDQFAVRGIAEETVLAVRLVAHWLAFAPVLLLASLPASALLGLDGATIRLVLLGLAAGTPGLAAIGLMIACLNVSVRGGAALSGLMVIPLAVPLLIFGAGALVKPDSAGIAIAGAISLGLCGIAPFVCGAAIRASRAG